MPENQSGALGGVVSRLFHPVKTDVLVRRFLHKKPKLIRNRTRKLTLLPTSDDIRCRLGKAENLRAVFSGLRQCRIQADEIDDMLAAGATVCGSGMEYAYPRLASIVEEIRTGLGYRGTVSVRCYVSPPGSGFDMHYDAGASTVIQIAGRKRWWYEDRPTIVFPPSASAIQHRVQKRPQDAKRSSLHSTYLSPGDILMLPAGTFHQAKAITSSTSLNIAFQVEGVRMIDMLLSGIASELVRSSFWRSPHLPPAATAGKAHRKRTVSDRRIAELHQLIDAIAKDPSFFTALYGPLT